MLGSAGVGHFCHEAGVAADGVGYGLDASVRQQHAVGALGVVSNA